MAVEMSHIQSLIFVPLRFHGKNWDNYKVLIADFKFKWNIEKSFLFLNVK